MDEVIQCISMEVETKHFRAEAIMLLYSLIVKLHIPKLKTNGPKVDFQRTAALRGGIYGGLHN